MTKTKWYVPSAMISALLWAVPMTATVKGGPAVHKPSPVAAKVARSAWPPETLAGKIMSVDAARQLVVVEGPGNVPYDMRVTRETRILAGKQPVKLDDLSSQINQQVSVRFTPERSGDIAQLIRLRK